MQGIRHTSLQLKVNTMLSVQEAIIEKLRSGPSCFDDLVTDLPNFSWGIIFVAVVCMSWNGRVFLRQLGYSAFQVSLGSHVASPVQDRVAEGKSASQSLEG
jgi:hypothetical protein